MKVIVMLAVRWVAALAVIFGMLIVAGAADAPLALLEAVKWAAIGFSLVGLGILGFGVCARFSDRAGE